MIVFGLLSSVFDILTFLTLRLGFHASATLARSGWFIESTITELAVMLVLRTSRPLLPKPPRPCCHPSPSPPSRSPCPTARWPDHSASPPSRPGSWPPSPGSPRSTSSPTRRHRGARKTARHHHAVTCAPQRPCRAGTGCYPLRLSVHANRAGPAGRASRCGTGTWPRRSPGCRTRVRVRAQAGPAVPGPPGLLIVT
jgi:hypothetical protein